MPNIRAQMKAFDMLPVVKPKTMVHLSEKDLKDIKDWEVGKEYVVEFRVLMKGKHDYNGKIEGDFEVTKVENETDDEEEEGEPLTSGAKNYKKGKKEKEEEDEDED